MQKADIYAQALKLFGAQAQINMLMEECAELIVTSNHFMRFGEDRIPELIDELADAEIMIEQVKFALNIQNEVSIQKEIKIERLRKRIVDYCIGSREEVSQMPSKKKPAAKKKAAKKSKPGY